MSRPSHHALTVAAAILAAAATLTFGVSTASAGEETTPSQATPQNAQTQYQSTIGTPQAGDTPAAPAQQAVDSDQECNVQSDKAVASVTQGDNVAYCSSLADAVADAQNGATVTLTAGSAERVTIGKAITVTADKDVTFTGNLTVTADGAKITGMTIVHESTDGSLQSVIVEGRNTEIWDNKFTIKPVNSGSKIQPNSIWLQGASGTNIHDNTFDVGQTDGAGTAINFFANNQSISNTTIADNTVTFTSAPDGTDAPESNFITANGQFGSPVVVDGLTVSGNTVTDETSDKSNNYGVQLASISGSGNLYLANNKLETNMGLFLNEEQRVSHAVTITADNTFGNQYVGTLAVSNTDNYRAYKTVSDALAAGATKLRLISGDETNPIYDNFTVENGKKVALDLNGHVIENYDEAEPVATVAEGGSLTVRDSSAAGAGAIEPFSVNGTPAPSSLVENRGTLDIQGGAFTSKGDGKTLVDNQGALTVSGGAFSGTSPLVRTANNASAKVTGGTFTANTDNKATLFSGEKKSTTLSGGLYVNVDPATEQSATIAEGYESQKQVDEAKWKIAAKTPSGGNGGGTVTVPDNITGIEITAKPSKTEYRIGEKLDADGLKVSLKWSSGKRDELKPAQYELSGFDSSKPGKVTVTVKLAWDESKIDSFDVMVMFRDVDSSTPHHEEIRTLLEKDITRGFADGTFRGMNSLNRQDLAAFLYRMAGQPAYEPAEEDFVFQDVTEATPHYREVLWAAKNGIVTGFTAADGTRTYGGDKAILRQDLAAMLHRLAGSPETNDVSFQDVNGETPFHEAIAWAETVGVTTGFPDNTFRGGQTIVRQDAAAFLGRVIDKNLIKF